MSASRPAIIKHRDVHFESRVVQKDQSPRVELLEEGGVVYALRVTCSCGKATVVELEYERTSTARNQ